MKKSRINMTVIKEDSGYSAYCKILNHFISTQAENFDDLKKNVLEAVNLSYEDKGLIYSIDEIKFTYDLTSFFEFYKVINASALSKRLNMSQSLLAQYIKGIKKPSAIQTQRILSGVKQIGKELSEINLI